jgi:diguanylate cyclase (GGDEF)-like protein/PAS domain S-box-containing protein
MWVSQILDFFRQNTDYMLFTLAIGTLFGLIELRMIQHLRKTGMGKYVRTSRELSFGWMKWTASSLTVLILVAGWFVVHAVGEQERERNKEIVAGIAPTFSYELQTMGHEGVRIATRSDDESYRKMVRVVSKWMSINPDIAQIYTLRKLQDGSVAYVIAPDLKTRQTTVIGETYPRSSPELEEAFRGKATFTSTPYPVDNLQILTAYEPIYDRFGKVEAILAIDFDSTVWGAKIAWARSYVMIFMLFLFIPLHYAYWIIFHTRVEKFRLKLHQQQLEESEDRFRKLSNATSEGIVVTERGVILEANPMFVAMFGYEPEELIGSPMVKLAAPNSVGVFDEVVSGGQDAMAEAYGMRKGGEVFDLELVGTSCSFEGRMARVVAVRDISERKRANEIINHMAYHDTLTGLPNRVRFHERVTMALQAARKNGKMVAIMFLDLDRFKLVNDTLGHQMGDKLLQGVAERVIDCVREGDVVARMGGDEFTVLLREIDDAQDAIDVSHRIINALREPFVIEGYELHTTTSIGIAIYPQDGEDAEGLMKNADTAMYRAKDHGRNNYSFYTPAMNQLGIERLELENGLRYALERGELLLHYQPRVNITTGRIIGAEALVRWQHPTLGLVSPGKFIPLAEETGLIVPIGEWVLEQACRQNKIWQEKGYPPMHIAVNLSARQFQGQGLVEKVRGVLEATGLEPEYLELEITESITMQDVEFTIRTLHELSSMGIQISIDDFGTGYSSLNYLKRFPIHTLKIDQSFIRESTNDPYNAAIVTTVIYLAQALRLKVIAEGVETVEQLAFLRENRCDEMQGYLFSRPLPTEQFEQMLKEQDSAEKRKLFTV